MIVMEGFELRRQPIVGGHQTHVENLQARKYTVEMVLEDP